MINNTAPSKLSYKLRQIHKLNDLTDSKDFLWDFGFRDWDFGVTF